MKKKGIYNTVTWFMNTGEEESKKFPKKLEIFVDSFAQLCVFVMTIEVLLIF